LASSLGVEVDGVCWKQYARKLLHGGSCF
jgi:phage tail protein X